MSRAREATDEIRRRVNILDVVSPHVTLRRSGRRYTGLCPFHSEKTPSFTVDPEKGVFHCFGCHAGGDVFDFVELIGSLSFVEARRELAARAGVTLEAPDPRDGEAGDRSRLLRALAEAEAFFRRQLAERTGEPARRYLASRGVETRIADRFRLGVAPAGWDSLIRALEARGFEASVLEQAGLAVARTGGSGHYDALRERIVFPIHDMQGRPVAFGGRVLDTGMPKYLNTRETALFTKGRLLYALSEAREAIRESGEAVVVEGYMDALTCHQYGVRNAVASLGTALTLDQVLLLKRFAPRAILVYDSDAAGIGAAERGLDVFDQGELPVRVVVLPGQCDPDAFLRRDGAHAFRRLCAGAFSLFDYRLTMAERRHDPRTVEGKVGIVNELSQLIVTVSNPVRQAEYVRILADRLGAREDAIRSQLGRLRGGQRPPGDGRRGVEVAPPDRGGRSLIERELLHLLVASPAVRESFRDRIAMEIFTEPDHRELAAALMAGDEADDPGALRRRLRSETAVSLLSRFLIAEIRARDPVQAAEACLARLRRLELQARVDALLEELRRAGGDRAGTLRVELQELYRELKVSAQTP